MNPKQGVLLASLIISVILSTLFGLLVESLTRMQLLIFFLVSLVVSILIIYGMTHLYLSKSLLPIYRTIFGDGSKNTEKGLDIMGNPLQEAEQNVSNWADQRIEEIKRLQEKDDYRKEFIGNLAHELKTPLFNIQGYVNSLLEGAMDDERVRDKFLEKASRNIDRMTRIVEDLDTISHLEFDRLELEIKRFNILECVKEVLESFEKKAEEKQIEIVLIARDEIMVEGDEFRLSQVMTNLVNNAITYGNIGGRVEVSFHDVKDRILIEVSDNGPGIDPNKLPRIFERFYRVDKSRSRDVGGSGLGLSIVKHIVEAHHQSIHAKSEVGKGSTFSFTLKKAKG